MYWNLAEVPEGTARCLSGRHVLSGGLFDRTAAKWSRWKGRARRRQFVSQTVGCLRLCLSDLRSKHGCTLCRRRWCGENSARPSHELRPQRDKKIIDRNLLFYGELEDSRPGARG